MTLQAVQLIYVQDKNTVGLRSPLRQSKKAAGIGSGEARIF
ncbi:hypothetical protein GGP85_003348, partial [Salinibacter ruber]|nr:hypothetical protein [Salinibacter ruber]